MNRRILVIALVSGVVAMAFAGVALSIGGGGTDTPAVGPTEAAEVLRKAPGTQEKVLRSPQVDGQTWGMRGYTNVRGERCLSNDVPGELTGTSCMAPDKLFAEGPLYAVPGARQVSAPYPKQEWDNQWVYGIAHPAIKELTLLNMDCSTVALSLDADGAFKHVAARADSRPASCPSSSSAVGRRAKCSWRRTYRSALLVTRRKLDEQLRAEAAV